ncbi:MAG: DedA family protein [Bacteroidales bacterium]|nr:DedA family protein [Bacteroidales bacterium]
MHELGYFALFATSFLAATILPFSSEAMVSAMAIGAFNPMGVLVVATLGNWLGSVVTYFMGYVGNWDRIERWLRIDKSKTDKYLKSARKYGAWLGLAVWVPVVGDVFALCMGLIRCNPLISNLSILVGKFVRYAVLIYLICAIK